ncbi:MAG: MmcQ/YjbR family DNA-binding protein [Bacillota bacterium]
MDFKTFREYCLNKPGVFECFPFDEETLVFKVISKMFALTNINREQLHINLKCEPEMAEDLRNSFEAVKPGYHMNKRYWNTVACDGTISDDQLFWLIDISYNLVVKGLKKAEKEQLAALSK